tara:strand:- start:113 stop:331 length:219 start_codon:yes stop_codon:yes gene_type:complete
MLTGPDLLDKIEDLGDISIEDIIRECGYVSKQKDGSEKLHYTDFYDAKLKAKGVDIDAYADFCEKEYPEINN